MRYLLRIIPVLILLTSPGRAQLSDELLDTYSAKDKDTAWVSKMVELTRDQFLIDFRGTIGYITSVRDIAKKLKHDKGYLEAVIQTTEYYRMTRQIDSADYHLAVLMDFANKSGKSIFKARARIVKGLLLSTKGEKKEAVAAYNEAVALIDTSKDQEHYATILTNRANDKSSIGQSEEAVNDYLRAARIFEKLKDELSLAIALNNIALELGKLGRYSQAVSYYNRAIAINQRIKNYYDLALCYSNASTSLVKLDSLETALRYNSKAIEIAQERGFTYTLAQSYMNAGSIYNTMNDPVKAEMWFRKSLNLCYKEGIPYGIMVNMLALADVFDNTNQPMKAVAHYDSALKYAEQLQSPAELNDLHGKMAKALAKTGDFERAYKYLRLFHDYSDSVKGGETAARIVELERMYENEKQATEIARLEQVTSNQIIIIVTLIAVAGASFSFIFFFRYKRRKAEEAGEKAAKHAQEIEKYSEELKELNATKDKLFSLISHDIRGPFLPILGFAEVLATQCDELDKEEITAMANDLHTVAGNTYFLIGNLLDWARAQTGRIAFTPEEIEFKSLLQSVHQNLGYALKDKGIMLAIDFPGDVRIRGDRMMISSILQNIIQNAVKFSYEGDEVIVTGKIEGKMLRISVTDSGVGMGKEIADNLFNPSGIRSERGTKDEKGTGLGLSLAAEFIERHSGTISVESIPGQGTTVSFTLPLAEAAV